MTEKFVKRNSHAFFRGKKATALTDLKNFGGEIIPKGVIVEIIRKAPDCDFDVKTTCGVRIYGVECEDLGLIK